MYETRDMQLLEKALMHYDELVERPYLHELSCFSTLPPAPCTLPIKLLQLMPFPSSTFPQYFTYILNALNGLDQVIGYIIISSSAGFSVYIGIKGSSCSSDALGVISSGVSQTFPDTKILPVEDTSSFLDHLFDPACYGMLASVLATPPSVSDDNALMKTFTQLTGTSQPYVMFFLASSYKRAYLVSYLDELFELYSLLSMFNQATFNVSEGLAKNASQTVARGSNETNGETANATCGTNESHNTGGYVNLSNTAPVTYGNNKNISISVLRNCAQAMVSAKNSSETHGNTHTLSHTYTHTKLSATNRTNNHGMNFNKQNKYVQIALETINSQITYVQSLLSSPCFQFNAYFFSAACETSLRAAYNFSGLCGSLSKSSEPNAVNFWSASDPNYVHLFEHLRYFEIPAFHDHDKCYLPASLISANELVSVFYL